MQYKTEIDCLLFFIFQYVITTFTYMCCNVWPCVLNANQIRRKEEHWNPALNLMPPPPPMLPHPPGKLLLHPPLSVLSTSDNTSKTHLLHQQESHTRLGMIIESFFGETLRYVRVKSEWLSSERTNSCDTFTLLHVIHKWALQIAK